MSLKIEMQTKTKYGYLISNPTRRTLFCMACRTSKKGATSTEVTGLDQASLPERSQRQPSLEEFIADMRAVGDAHHSPDRQAELLSRFVEKHVASGDATLRDIATEFRFRSPKRSH